MLFSLLENSCSLFIKFTVHHLRYHFFIEAIRDSRLCIVIDLSLYELVANIGWIDIWMNEVLTYVISITLI